MKLPLSPFSRKRELDEKRAFTILRKRLFQGSSFTEEEVQDAVRYVRACDPDHPLLRYSERHSIDTDAT